MCPSFIIREPSPGCGGAGLDSSEGNKTSKGRESPQTEKQKKEGNFKAAMGRVNSEKGSYREGRGRVFVVVLSHKVKQCTLEPKMAQANNGHKWGLQWSRFRPRGKNRCEHAARIVT